MKRRELLMSVPVLGLAAVGVGCTTGPPSRVTTVASVDVERYLGRWYDVASVKQFFSAGLVNITADYSLRDDGNIRVLNTGYYFRSDGPRSQIVGSAFPVDDTNARLNVSFSGSNSSSGAGNYWIVDLDADYRWAIVSDPSGQSCFLLKRTPDLSDDLYRELLDRARTAGVSVGNVSRTTHN